MNPKNLTRRSYFLISLLIFPMILCSILASGQKKKTVMQKAKENIDDATALVTSIRKFMAVTNMNTEQFNKTVKVDKGVSGKKYNYDAKPTNEQGPITKPKMNKKGKFTNLEWKPVTYFEKQIFPAEVISMAFYHGPALKGKKEAISRPLGFRIKSENTNMPINWEIECMGKQYFKKMDGYIVYNKEKDETDLMPELAWDYEALSNQQSSTPIDICFRMFDADGNKSEKIEHMYLRSINNCLYRFGDVNLQYLFAGFIQEEHPEIEKIKKEALKTKMVESLCGYCHGEKYVQKEVAAVWRVLHDRGFQYSMAMENNGTDPDDTAISYQIVKTFSNAIATNQANCVEGSIVFASILTSMNIYPVLILTNDHCFLGYYTDKNKNKISYLETTKLSESDIIDQNKNGKKKNDAYYEQFLAAQKEGQKEFDELTANGEKIIKVDVADTRKYVKPIPFAKTSN